MLKHLTIRNYALIRHLEFSPDSGLTVITGETGAGKSIMLGALGLILGNRADSKVLLDHQEKCVSEGVFDIGNYGLESLFEELELDYSPEVILRREISPAGKSRAFINDTPVNLENMKRVGYRLMDIHSQHETLELGDQPFQLKFIDACAGNQIRLKDYASTWQKFREAENHLKTLEAEARRLNEESDFIRFQFEELEKIQLTEGEQEQLESVVNIGENAELIRSRLESIAALLSESDHSSRKILGEIRSQLGSIASYDPALSLLLERIESLKVETDDIASEIRDKSEQIDYDPKKVSEAQERLDLIYQLLRKHRVSSVTDLIQIHQKLSEKVFKTDHLEEELALKKSNLESIRTELHEKAETLSKNRKKILPAITSEAVELLKEMGIPNARFEIRNYKQALTASGADVVELQFSANKGIDLRPIAETASGGEFSRLMFAIKFIMARHTSMPTLILDEIDSGISGDVALKLGHLMKKMSGNHQVVAISHLAQIAARADAHHIVFKENQENRTTSQIKLLEQENRIQELARIISGNSPSATALKYAKELMQG